MIDYVIATNGFRSLIHLCDVVRTAACGTHVDVRTTLAPAPALLLVKTMRRPKSLEAAVDHFGRIGLVRPAIAPPTWEQAWAKTHKQAKAHVIRHRAGDACSRHSICTVVRDGRVPLISFAGHHGRPDFVPRP